MRSRTALLAALLAAVGLAGSAHAGTITFYTDRDTWLADAAAAGLTVDIERFASPPPSLSTLTIGPATLEITSSRAEYVAALERIGFTSGGGRALGFDITASSRPLFGFGLDMGPTIGNLYATDIEGDDVTDSGSDGFVGMLGTAPLDPANPFPSNGAFSGNAEFGTSGLWLNVYMDDIVVATSVPEPGAAALLLGGAALLAARTRRR